MCTLFSTQPYQKQACEVSLRQLALGITLLTSPTVDTRFAGYCREEVTRTLFLFKLMNSLQDNSNHSMVINAATVSC